LAVGLLLAAFGIAEGASLLVEPGPGTPLQTAIDLADPGDTIRLGAGTFSEAIVVTKSLRIVGAFDGAPRDRTQPNLPTIDAGCSAPYAIDVAARGVRLERLDVQRGSEGAVRIVGGDKVQVWDVRPRAIQGNGAASCGTERYGFNVSGGGKIKLAGGSVRGNTAITPTGLGFRTAGIRIANVVAAGRVDVKDYASFGNTVGVLIEDSLGPGVKLKKLAITAPDTGVLLRNSRQITVRKTTVNAANGLSATVGIHCEEDTGDNHLSSNELSGADVDLLDEGFGNCWRHNDFITGTLPPFNCFR
jgi:hypothetical protein